MNGTLELRTNRLVLRRYRLNDVNTLYSNFGTDDAMYEYSGWNPYATAEAARNTIQQFIARYEEPYFYGWAIEAEQHLVGTAGAYDYNAEENSIEIGISIMRDCWGNGFASEALQRILSYLTREEGIETVRAWCADANTGSRKAMEQAGMMQTSCEREALHIKGSTFDKLNYEYHGT